MPESERLGRSVARLVRRPFKGSFAYEWQVGPLVIQWFYKRWEYARFFGRLHLWRDPLWRS